MASDLEEPGPGRCDLMSQATDERDAGPLWVRLVAPAGLFVLAVAVRALTWPRVLGENWIFAAGNDAYYHLRRIVYSVVNSKLRVERVIASMFVASMLPW